MYSQFQSYLSDAINEVLAWGISDESFADAVIAQAGFMARVNPEDKQVDSRRQTGKVVKR